MNEDEATRLFSRAAQAIPPVRLAPAHQLISGGKRLQRRQRLLGVVGVAAAAALTVGAGALWLPGSSGSADAPPAGNETNAGPTENDLPAAPSGTRWLGFNGVMVAVPRSWSVNDTRCGQPLSDTVVFHDTGDVRDCLAPGSDRFSLLRAVSLSSPVGSRWRGMEGEAEDIDGVPATRVNRCDSSVSPMCNDALIVPSRDAVFLVALPDDAGAAVLDSARLVPDGYSAVPSLLGIHSFDAEDVVSEAGLTFEPPCRAENCRFALLVFQEPLAGSIVTSGSAVTASSEPDEPQKTFEPKPLPPDPRPGTAPVAADLIGTWRLQPAPDSDTADDGRTDLTFSADGSEQLRWSGYDGCNGQGGSVKLGSDGTFALTFGDATLIACDHDGSAVLVMEAAHHVRLDAGQLTFYDGDNERLGTFVRTG